MLHQHFENLNKIEKLSLKYRNDCRANDKLFKKVCVLFLIFVQKDQSVIVSISNIDFFRILLSGERNRCDTRRDPILICSLILYCIDWLLDHFLKTWYFSHSGNYHFHDYGSFDYSLNFIHVQLRIICCFLYLFQFCSFFSHIFYAILVELDGFYIFLRSFMNIALK